MAENDVSERVKDLEREADMVTIEYFTKMREREGLKEKCYILDAELSVLDRKFRDAKVAQLRAKHGLADGEPTGQ